MAQAFRDAGMGDLHRVAPDAGQSSAALQEDVQVNGISILSGAHMQLLP